MIILGALKYLTSAEKEKTIAYVAGEGEGKYRKGRYGPKGIEVIYQARTNSGGVEKRYSSMLEIFRVRTRATIYTSTPRVISPNEQRIMRSWSITP